MYDISKPLHELTVCIWKKLIQTNKHVIILTSGVHFSSKNAKPKYIEKIIEV